MRALAVSCSLLLLCAVFLACTQNPADNPEIKDRFKQLNDLTQRVAYLEEQLTFFSNQLDELQTKMVEQPPMAPSEVPKALTQRLDNLEKQLGSVQKNMEQMATARRRVSVPEQPVPKPAISEKELVKPTPPREVSPDTYAQPTGFYHKVQAGDTLEALAKQFGVSKEAILHANSMPANARLFTGQQLFIPKKK